MMRLESSDMGILNKILKVKVPKLDQGYEWVIHVYDWIIKNITVQIHTEEYELVLQEFKWSSEDRFYYNQIHPSPYYRSIYSEKRLTNEECPFIYYIPLIPSPILETQFGWLKALDFSWTAHIAIDVRSIPEMIFLKENGLSSEVAEYVPNDFEVEFIKFD